MYCILYCNYCLFNHFNVNINSANCLYLFLNPYLLLQFIYFTCKNEFIKVADKSSLEAHARGRKCTQDLIDEKCNSTVVNMFMFCIIDHELLTVVEKYPVLNLGDCCMKTMSKLTKYSIEFIIYI